jgi:arylsulfatase A-like enzyme
MRNSKLIGACAPASLAVCLLAISPAGAATGADAAPAGPAPQTCHLGTGIQHIVHIQFDNVHFRRDIPNVPSDLEQMPSLLNFLEQKGTLLANHHTPLISHTSVDILTTLTGVYGAKMGMPIGNTIEYYNPDGSTSFTSAFAYWTDRLGTTAAPQMVDQRGLVHPAPWVPFTRAGCDVGAFSVANIEFENVTSDIDNVFGPTSSEHTEAATNRNLAAADFDGIAIHCARGSARCTSGQQDVLTDEPGGYAGFNALFGNKFVAPAITGGQAGVLDLDNKVIADSRGNVGFPGFSPTPSQSLGYIAQMLEAGVPVVYAYISDAHDNHSVPSNPDGTFGPGEAGYVSQLKAYDTAFATFFARLAQDGITADNTLFIVTADENDHFVGAAPTPANCDGINIPCTYPIKGEVEASLPVLLNAEFADKTSIGYDFDSAPGIWINNDKGGQTDAVTRNLEQHIAALTGFDPVIGGPNQVMQRMADQTEQRFLHMVTSDPNRTPNFVLFSNPDYFFTDSFPAPKSCTPPPLSSCFVETRNFAWNHGDFQEDIVHTWLGIVGPGVRHEGVTNALFTDHSDVRPTILSLAGLKDDYAHDGRVIFEILHKHALPDAVRDQEETLHRLAVAYKNINAPVGPLGLASLQIATAGIISTNAHYARVTESLRDLTEERDEIAGAMIQMLEDAAFHNKKVNEERAERLIDAAEDLLRHTR